MMLSFFFALPLYAVDTEVQDLTDITSPISSDDMYIVDDPDGTPISRKINIGNLLGVATDLDTGGAVSANAVALTTDTTGNYAAGDAEAGSALTGDAAVDFFGAGVDAVTGVGTPVNNEIGVWTGDGTLEGDTNFQWTGTALTIVGTIDMSDNEITDIGFMDMNLTNGVAAAEGRIVWNDTDGTINVGLKGGNVNLQVGQEQVLRVKNVSGSTINDGQVVRITGATGVNPTIDLSEADVFATSGTIGLVTEDIINNAFGYVTTFGLVRDIDTTGTPESETWSAGDLLFLSNTAGAMTKVVPTSNERKVFVGTVIVSNATTGIIWANPINTSFLKELSGNNFGTEVQFDHVEFNGTVWENKANITQAAGTTLFMGGLLDATGAVDMDYGSADITDHTFTTDSVGTAEIVLPAGAIDSTEILDGTILEVDLNSTNAPTDNFVLTFNSAGSNFTWAADADSGGAPEGTAVLSTGEVGGTKFLREDGDNSCSWQTVVAGHDGTITWTGTSILESGAAFQFGDGTDATVTHTYGNTGTDVSIAYSTAAMGVTGALTATNLSGTNTGDNTVATSGDSATSFFSSGTLEVGIGGTGQTTYTDGQLLIGNTTGNTLAKSTLTEGEGIDVTNGNGTITILGEDASVTNKGVVEFATTAEIDAGTDSARAMPVDQFEASDYGKKTVSLLLNAGTDLATGDGKIFFRLPDELAGWSITNVRAARATGTGTDTYMLRNVTQTADVLSTILTMDTGELDSNTAAVPPVINTGEDDGTLFDRYAIDVDSVGSSTTFAEFQVTFERIP